MTVSGDVTLDRASTATPARTHTRNGLPLWQPGQSGNPAGRKPGSRNKLSTDFVDALYQSFQRRGAEAIERVITDDPAKYLAIIAAVVPKELNVKTERLEDMPDAEVLEALDTIRGLLAKNVTTPASKIDYEPVKSPEM